MKFKEKKVFCKIIKILTVLFVILVFNNGCSFIPFMPRNKVVNKPFMLHVQVVDKNGTPIKKVSVMKFLADSSGTWKDTGANGWVSFKYNRRTYASLWIWIGKENVGTLHVELPSDKSSMRLMVQPGFRYEIKASDYDI